MYDKPWFALSPGIIISILHIYILYSQVILSAGQFHSLATHNHNIQLILTIKLYVVFICSYHSFRVLSSKKKHMHMVFGSDFLV